MIQFHSTQLGPPADRAPVLLFLHGFMGSVEDWRGVMQALSDEFCCLAIDLPGHGQTGRGQTGHGQTGQTDRTQCQDDRDYVMENTAAGITDLLTSLDIAAAIPVGYSMGGRVALYCSLSFPQRFPQAIIESASPGLRSSKDRKIRRDQDLERSRQIKTDFLNFLETWYQQPLFTTLQKFSTGFEEMWKRRLNNSPEGLAIALEQLGLGRQPSLWSELVSHPNPILLLTGDLDQKFTRINREMAAQNHRFTHRILPQTGHNLHLEQPQRFVEEVRAWLRPLLA